MAHLLHAQGISKDFGGVRALNYVDIGVAPMETVGLIGPNGAGKTTLFNVICGLPPTVGRVFFKGNRRSGASAGVQCLCP